MQVQYCIRLSCPPAVLSSELEHYEYRDRPVTLPAAWSTPAWLTSHLLTTSSALFHRILTIIPLQLLKRDFVLHIHHH